MALKLHSLITATLMSLILTVALLPATAVAQSQPERMEAAAESDFMKAIVKRYREMVQAISRALSNNDDLKEGIAKTRQDEAIAQALRDNPEAMKPQQPANTPNAYTPVTPVGKPFVPPTVVSTPQPYQSPTQPQQPQQQAPTPYVPPVYTPPAYTPPSSTPSSSIGSARLTWNIPTRRENGESLPINEIASYEIYMTAESTGASRTIRVSDPSKTQFTLVPLSADTYHFSMATVDADGTYSGLSQVVSKTVR